MSDPGHESGKEDRVFSVYGPEWMAGILLSFIECSNTKLYLYGMAPGLGLGMHAF